MGLRPAAIEPADRSKIARYYDTGKITEAQYHAGLKYGQVIRKYLQSIDAPDIHGNGFGSLTEKECLQRKIICNQARETLKDAARRSGERQSQVIAAVDNFTVYDEYPKDERELRRLIIGLHALAGTRLPEAIEELHHSNPANDWSASEQGRQRRIPVVRYDDAQ